MFSCWMLVLYDKNLIILTCKCHHHPFNSFKISIAGFILVSLVQWSILIQIHSLNFPSNEWGLFSCFLDKQMSMSFSFRSGRLIYGMCLYCMAILRMAHFSFLVEKKQQQQWIIPMIYSQTVKKLINSDLSSCQFKKIFCRLL